MSEPNKTGPDIPHVLRDAILRGEAILFLGAGASIGARHPEGQEIPTAETLRNQLSDRYLGGDMKDRPLATVAQLAENESSRTDLQSFIRDIFLPFEPAPFHLKIPTFRWHSIITTNYDLVINKAYERTQNRLQTLIPFSHNGQQVERETRRAQHPVQFLKLHGCIDHIGPNDAPLILTSEQYVKYLDSRDRLFGRLQDWAREFPLVFCGYGINDPNVQAVLFDLFDDKISRPMYYVVSPGITEYESRYWLRHRLTPIHATFAQFLDALDTRISPNARVLQSVMPRGDLSISKFYARANVTESAELRSYLVEDVLHVRPAMPITEQKPSDFYRGYDTGFGAFAANLDVARHVTDDVLLAAVLAEETASRSVCELFVIKGAAGNGKSTVLKRAAWDAAQEFEALVLWVHENGVIREEMIAEIYEHTQKRVFVFVDRAAMRSDQILRCLQFCRSRGIKVSIVTAERDNEWNTRCDDLDPLLTEAFPVRYLNEVEVEKLLDKLSAHNSLGLLAGQTREAQKSAFMDRAQRQLLVALHEATQGKPFADIVVNEYNRIVPDEARLLYLDICTLNRFGVGVRAGVISRVSGLDFERFREELFRPLENIVFTTEDKYSRDRVYRTRHPHVAEIVFAEILKEPERRLEQLIRILAGLNIDYTVDREAFNQMVRGRSVADTFPSVEMGRAIFKAAKDSAGQDPFVLHQEGIFEMAHDGGSMTRAGELLARAEELASYDKSIQHSVANWLRKLALDENNPLKRQELRKRALEKLTSLQSGSRTRHSYEINTRLNVLIDELKEALPTAGSGEDKKAERVWVEKIREIEEELVHAHQRYPNDEHLLMTEVAYRTAIADAPRAQAALERAFQANPRQEWIAVRLADLYERREDPAAATSVLLRATTENPVAKQAHLRLGKIRAASASPEERAMALQHFRSSFSNGDSNYEAQFAYGRELFIQGQYDTSQQVFEQLKTAPVAPALRNELRDPVKTSAGDRAEFRGSVAKKEDSFLFIRSPSHGRDIYAHAGGTDSASWNSLRFRDDVRFAVAFTYRGPRAVDVERA